MLFSKKNDTVFQQTESLLNKYNKTAFWFDCDEYAAYCFDYGLNDTPSIRTGSQKVTPQNLAELESLILTVGNGQVIIFPNEVVARDRMRTLGIGEYFLFTGEKPSNFDFLEALSDGSRVCAFSQDGQRKLTSFRSGVAVPYREELESGKVSLFLARNAGPLIIKQPRISTEKDGIFVVIQERNSAHRSYLRNKFIPTLRDIVQADTDIAGLFYGVAYFQESRGELRKIKYQVDYSMPQILAVRGGKTAIFEGILEKDLLGFFQNFQKRPEMLKFYGLK